MRGKVKSEKKIYVGKSKHSRQYVAPREGVKGLTRQGEGVRAEFDTYLPYKMGTYLRYIGEIGRASVHPPHQSMPAKLQPK